MRVLPLPDHIVYPLLLLPYLVLNQFDSIFQVTFFFVIELLRFIYEPILLVVICKLSFRNVELLVVAVDQVLTLFNLSLNLVSSGFDRANFRLFAFYISLDLSHLCL